MKDRPNINSPPPNCINKFFWNAPNPMTITMAMDGTYIEVNDSFAKCMGLRRQDIIGQTSIGIGYITADQRSLVAHEISENGYAENVELDVRVKKNKSRCGLFNSTPIKMGKNALWLTVVTDVTMRKRAKEAREENVLFKSLSAIVGTGVVLIRNNRKQSPDIFFINEEAKRALKNQLIHNLIDTLAKNGSTYLTNNNGFYHVKMISTNWSSPLQIILAERLPDALFIKEKLNQKDLTPRQQEIAFLASIGRSNKEIAEALFISEYTVKDHCKEIYQKMGIGKRSQLIPKILRWEGFV